MAADETPTPPRYVVTGGGRVSPEELAAIAVALTPVVVEEAPDDESSRGPRSGWTVAALHEGVGHRPFVAAPDLAAGRFPLG